MDEQRPATSNHADPPDLALRILILEDSEFDAELILHELQQLKMPFSTKRVETREAFLEELRSFLPDLILADYSLPAFDGLSAFEMVCKTQAELPFIFVSGAVGEELAIDLIKRGATDFVLKNRLALLVPTVQRALIESNERKMRKKAEEERDSLFRALESRVQERTRALQESERRFRLLSDTAGRLLATDDPQGLVNELCRDVMEYLDCQAFFNFMVDEHAGRLRLNACAGIPEEEVRKLEWLDYGVAVCGCAARDKTRIIAEDIFHSPDVRTELVRSYGIQAYCCHPLKTQERLIGTLSFGTKTRVRFTPEEVELMRIVADQVSVAMQRVQAEHDLLQSEKSLQLANEHLEQRVRERTMDLQNLTEQLERSRHDLRNLASELVMAEERERKRIAGILHDEVAQTLAAAKMRIDMLKGTPSDQEQTLKETKALLAQSIQETRTLMNDLGNPLLFDLGLKAACEALADRLMERHPVRIRCDIRDAFKNLNPDVKTIVYQVVRELLSNVMKHGHAQNAHVMIDMENRQFRVKVTDDGVGFDPQTLGPPTVKGGFGLYSIRERLITVDGNLRIESAPGTGTVVTAIMPAALD